MVKIVDMGKITAIIFTSKRVPGFGVRDPRKLQPEKIAMASTSYLGRKIGSHHLAHLRGVAEGLDVTVCARIYLGIEHSREAQTAHDEITARVRLAARQLGERHHRLIGIRIKDKVRQALAPGGQVAPTLSEYVAQKGLEGWSESEQVDMYSVDHPTQTDGRLTTEAMQRRELSRQRVVSMLDRLTHENSAIATPQVSDEVTAWFADHLAKRLICAGYLTLGELVERIRLRGAWYTGVTSIGVKKAIDIERQIEQMMPGALKRSALFAGRPGLVAVGDATPPGGHLATTDTDLAPHQAGNLGGIESDADAVEKWVNATAGSEDTAKSYRREARRLMLWLTIERGGKRLCDFQLDDAQAYAAFLAYVPDAWISRTKAAPGDPGWSPFRGQISAPSQRQALRIVGSWFEWLASAQYVRANPWRLIRKQGQNREPEKSALDTQALSSAAMGQVMAFIERQPDGPAKARARFLIEFLALTGLRSAELLGASAGDVQFESEGVFLKVTGKGQKIRRIVLVDAALQALEQYFATRGFASVNEAPAGAPLIAHQADSMQPVGYMTLYKTTKRWIARGVDFSDLSQAEKSKLVGASTHWLRHTFGTNAVAAGVPVDVIQAQMGHASINTTMSTYSRAPLARQAAELKKGFEKLSD